MALINCSECDKQVSDKAISCPNCGNPIANSIPPPSTRSTNDSDFKPVESNSVKCPKCNSTNVTANKKGYGVGKAAVGVVLTGGIGLAAGAIGMNKVDITCLECGYKHKAGKYYKEKSKIEAQKQMSNTEFDPLIAGVVIPPIAGFFLGVMIGIFGDGHWWYIFTFSGVGFGISIVVLAINHFVEKSKRNPTIKIVKKDALDIALENSNYISESINMQVDDYLKGGDFEKAIKFYQNISGCTSEEATIYINQRMDENGNLDDK